MTAERTKHLFREGKTIERVLRHGVRRALLEHKRAGNTIAVWADERVVLIPAAEIQVADEEALTRDEA